MGAVIGFFLVLTVYLQIGLGYSVPRSGLTTIAWGAAVPLLAGVSAGVLTPTFGRRGVQFGILLTIIAMLGLIWTVPVRTRPRGSSFPPCSSAGPEWA